MKRTQETLIPKKVIYTNWTRTANLQAMSTELEFQTDWLGPLIHRSYSTLIQ